MKKIWIMAIAIIMLWSCIITSSASITFGDYKTGLIESGEVAENVKLCTSDSDGEPDMIATVEDCPDCGIGTLYSVCSGVRKMNGSKYYFYVQCYVGTHPSGCQTVQTRYYTDKICTNPNCNYRYCNVDNHIQSYFHSLDESCFDDCYCSLTYVPR